MREYITVWSVGNDGKLTFAYETKEQVVRCRDCNLFDDHYLKCFRPVLYFDHDFNPHWTDETNFTAVTDATPDGFCKWGDERE